MGKFVEKIKLLWNVLIAIFSTSEVRKEEKKKNNHFEQTFTTIIHVIELVRDLNANAVSRSMFAISNVMYIDFMHNLIR